MSENKPSKTSGPESSKEPKQERVEPAASAKPAAASATPYAAVSGKGPDPIQYSRAVPAGKTGPRRSLTVYHVQRRLHELGFVEAYSEVPYGSLTARSVAQFQASRKEPETGVLTRKQFEDLFDGDVNVDMTIDTIGDHPVS